MKKSRYDAVGRKIADTDADGRVTAYTHDALGRLSKTVEDKNNLAIETRFEYNLAGERTKVTAVNGATLQHTTYEFDDFGRLARQTYPDADDKVFEYDNLGRLVEMTDQRGNVFTYTFKPNTDYLAGVAVTRAAGVSGTSEMTFTYDRIGRRTRVARLKAKRKACVKAHRAAGIGQFPKHVKLSLRLRALMTGI